MNVRVPRRRAAFQSALGAGVIAIGVLEGGPALADTPPAPSAAPSAAPAGSCATSSALLRIVVDPPEAQVWRGDSLVKADVDECVAAGSYFLRAEAAGKKTKSREVTLLPGERRTESLALSDLPPQAHKPLRFAGFLLMAAGAGGLVVAGGLAHKGLDQTGTVDEKVTYPLFSAATLITSGLVLGVGVYVVVLASQWGTPKPESDRKVAGLRWEIGAAPTAGGALGVIRGDF